MIAVFVGKGCDDTGIAVTDDQLTAGPGSIAVIRQFVAPVEVDRHYNPAQKQKDDSQSPLLRSLDVQAFRIEPDEQGSRILQYEESEQQDGDTGLHRCRLLWPGNDGEVIVVVRFEPLGRENLVGLL